MTPAGSWSGRLQEAREACRQALWESLPRACIPREWQDPEHCFAALARITGESGMAALAARRPALGDPAGAVFERWLLASAGLVALPRVAALPVSGAVKALFAEEFLFFARPTGAWQPLLVLPGVRFSEMARVATLRRFPAGQFHWENSGFPRSFLWRTRPREWPRLAACLLRDLRGFQPLVETHINARRRNRLTLSEQEGLLSYYRIARSVELQPEIRGLVTGSWLYCKTTAEVTPRLAWARRFFAGHGAFLGTLGPAPPDSGFLAGSEERARLYEAGRYRPQFVYVLWPRRAMLAWSAAHPELDEQ